MKMDKKEKISNMEETVEEIVKMDMEKVKYYGNDDKGWILDEVSRRLMNESSECLKDEYLTDYH